MKANRFFLDTAFVLALLNPKETYHEYAKMMLPSMHLSHEIFSKIRKATQFTSLAASSMIFIIALYGILIHNDSYFEIGLLLFGFIIVGGILLSPILGRFWCGWLCPRGTFLEYVLEKVSKKKKIPDILRNVIHLVVLTYAKFLPEKARP